MKRDESGTLWRRIGRSLLGNALYFAGCGGASCAVFGCVQGAIIGVLAIFFVPDVILSTHGLLPLASFLYAGWGAIIGLFASLPSFAIAGCLRGAAPCDLQRDELVRACATARRAALICGAAGLFSGPLLSFVTSVPLWALWPVATTPDPLHAADLIIGGALSGLMAGNVIGIWVGALFPATIEAAVEKSSNAQRFWREWR